MAAVAMLLAAAAHGTDASRDLSSYVLFGYEALSFKGEDGGAGAAQTRGLIVGGNVGVNAVDPHYPPGPLLNMCGGGSGHRVWMSDGSQVVSDTAGLQSPCNLANLFVNRLTGGSPPVVREQGPTAFTAPIINPALLPVVPAFSPGTTAVTVESNTTVSLPPGAYGLVRVKDDGTLTLSAGTYQIDELSGGKQVHINTVDGTVLLVATEFGVNNDANIGPACGAQIWVRSDGLGANDFSVHFSKHTEAHGQYFAPNGIISLGDDTDLFGRFIGREVRSGWNTNVSHCLGAGGPAATSTPTLTATASATRTATASATATATRTATRTASATATATATATVVPSATATDTATPTATATATETETPTATATPSATVTATWTATTTPIPSGALLGEVFDDGTAQPLAGVAVIASAGASATSDGAGRYALPALTAGGGSLVLSKDGYTRSHRIIEVTGHAAARVHDARLTRLAAAQTLTTAGGTIATELVFPSPLLVSAADQAGSAEIELSVSGSDLSETTDIRLTPLSPQGLIAPPPLGWSVLFGVDIQATPAPPSTIGVTLRVPVALLSAAAGAPVVTALWDDAGEQWLGGPPSTTVGDMVEIAGVPLPAGASAPPSTQLALLVADSVPAAPPPIDAGEPLQGVPAALAAVDAALVTAAPPIIISSPSSGAVVLVQADAPAPLPSGTLLEARLSEHYDLRDGRRLLGTRSRQDVVAYQRAASGGAPLPSPGALGAAFALAPSRVFVLGALREGRVRIDVAAADAAAAPGLIDAAGGIVSGANGVTFTVPADAVAAPVVIDVQPLSADALPGGAGTRPDFAGGLSVEVSGGVLDPQGAYALGFGTTIADGRRFAIARLDTVDQRSLLVFVGLGHSSNGAVVLEACPTGLADCLPGIGGSGSYAAFELDDDAALVTGTVRDADGARMGLAVESDTSALIAITDAGGGYALPAPAGSQTTLTCQDRAHDLHGAVSVTPDSGDPPAVVSGVDIQLAPTAPRVIDVSPPNHGSNISRSGAIAISFSEPIAAASISDSSVRLFRLGAGAPVAIDVRRSLAGDGTALTITPASLLEPDTLYRLELTAAVTDRTGTALVPFTSDFTTALTFSAAALPPNTLRVSLPDGDGRVFVCGGAQLAVPGTMVDVINDTTGELITVVATDLHGVSGSDVCDTLFPTRCDTSQPGSFCGVVSGLIGEHVQVQVEDPFGALITLDAGNMRDERTGATAIGADGGVVTFPGDERYEAFVPAGAFDDTTIVQLTPITDTGVGLDLADFPVLTSLDQSKIEFVGAVQLDFAGHAKHNIDISVPAPADAAAEDQYIATQVVNFRGVDEQTMVDTAFFDADGCAAHPDRCLVITDPGIFPGLVTGGIFGVHKATECLAFATGFISLGEHFNDGYAPGGVFGGMLPFPVQMTEPVHFALPVPCNHPVEVQLLTFDDQPIDTRDCGGVSLSRGEVCELLGYLTDDTKPPAVQNSSVPSGAVDVDPLGPIQVTVDESLDPTSVGPDSCELTGSDGPVKGRCTLSEDGRRIVFIPDIRLHFGDTYTLRLDGLRDVSGLAMAPFASSFTTFAPRILQHIDIDARDVVWIDPATLGGSPCDDLIAIAEGDATKPDFQGGIAVFNVTDLAAAPTHVTSIATSGVDRSLTFATGAVSTTGQHAQQLDGPFIMSIDGAGDPDRFGAWRLFDLSQFPALRQVAVRLVNQSGSSWAQLNIEDPQGTLLQSNIGLVPNEVGLPLDVASFGTQISYIANAPTIGLQAIAVQGMNADFLVTPQVDGTLLGVYRAVTTLGNRLVAVRQDGPDNTLVVADAQLTGVSDSYVLPPGGRPLAVTGLHNWLSRPDFGVDPAEPRDLAVSMCGNDGICVIPVDTQSGTFAPTALANGIGHIRTPGGSARAVVGDPITGLVMVADGTAGLTVVDLSTPGGSRDDDGDAIDDRVLGTLDLQGARAYQVAMFRDLFGRLIAAVATGANGLFLVEVAPAPHTTSDDLSALSATGDPLPCFALDLVRPLANQEFHMDMAGPTMPLVEVEVAVSPALSDLEYRFQIGNLTLNRAMEYEDSPTGYHHPPVIDSGPVTAPVWPLNFHVDGFGDVYGGHVTDITVTVTHQGQEVARRTFQRDVFILGDQLTEAQFSAYLNSKGLPCQSEIIAGAIARSEGFGSATQFEFRSGAQLSPPDTARHFRYPLKDRRDGFGVFQLTSPVPTREQIWNWKANVDEAVNVPGRIDTAYQQAVNRLSATNCPACVPPDKAHLRLEAYAKYNGGSGGFYHVIGTSGSQTVWMEDPNFACTCSASNHRVGREVNPPIGACRPLSQCYANVTSTLEIMTCTP